MLDTVRGALVAVLAAQGLDAAADFPDGRLDNTAGPVVCVGIAGGKLVSSGGGEYLGLRDAGGSVAELYGFSLDIRFSLDIYAPRSGGAAACTDCFSQAVGALGGLPSGLKLRSLSCGPVEFDRSTGMFLLRAELDCGAYLIAESNGDTGEFADFTLKGTVT